MSYLRKSAKWLAFLLLSPFIFTTSSCDTCVGGVLAELGIEMLAKTATTIALGDPFSLSTIIANAFEAGKEISEQCLGDAGPNRTRMTVERLTGSNNWSPVPISIGNGNQNLMGGFDTNIQDILANDDFVYDEELSFQDTGIFRIQKIVDYYDEVPEHNMVDNVTDLDFTYGRSKDFSNLPDYDPSYLYIEVRESFPGQLRQFKDEPTVIVH
ncbi:MAG: hypothetical protein NXI25_08615 [bacterium]|jgi:hypothetical protein|nr:hypothetical protein [bacterium]